ncbi:MULTISPECIES: dephospho-CoA kinase [unclassified Pseudoalteromonas]|uniref:dephospho-CoA kinase n=1 Tax=unclassified Pseudoalteromonas TaxID=194690 RepID=UPI001EEC4666|nr:MULTISPECIES: dephospho-CoA kinase [unclassified Pseudoalteromonas]MCF2828911.1 dephospho-CoA kinase [Pseudoalteromonas sp. OF5H-5]MCF2829933.1 dephospho-CoA kinase [Pseudoalteromonas sp. DL2-H6]MCF2926152.1 dephospho-CoA kinase [Pseudoalteromonas sp. DL2-H1]
MLKTNNWILGVTGGIGAGKTAITNHLQQKGIVVVDADIVAREVVALGSTGLQAITDEFGSAILQPDGNLDRAKLRAIIFADADKKQWLNELLHPLIRNEILTQLNAAQSDYVVLAAPLLFENGLERYCDATLLVDVAVDTQIARTTSRDLVDAAQVNRIIESQLPRSDKQAKADYILDNDRPLLESLQETDRLHNEFINLAKVKVRLNN